MWVLMDQFIGPRRAIGGERLHLRSSRSSCWLVNYSFCVHTNCSVRKLLKYCQPESTSLLPFANNAGNIDRGKVWVCQSMAAPKKCHFPWGGIRTNTWFLDPRVHTLNGMSIGSSLFAEWRKVLTHERIERFCGFQEQQRKQMSGFLTNLE